MTQHDESIALPERGKELDYEIMSISDSDDDNAGIYEDNEAPLSPPPRPLTSFFRVPSTKLQLYYKRLMLDTTTPKGVVANTMPAAATAATSPDERQRRRAVFDFRVTFYGFVIHTLVQLQHIHCPWAERWQRIGSVVGLGAFAAIPAFYPTQYLHVREYLVALFKIVFFSFPNLRKNAGVQEVLNDNPSSVGFWVDMIKIGWACRLFAILLGGLALPHSNVLLNTFVHLYMSVCTRMNPTLRATPLLRHPVFIEKSRQFSALMSMAVMPSYALGSILPRGDGGDDDSGGREASLLITWLHLMIGVLIPQLPMLPLFLGGDQTSVVMVEGEGEEGEEGLSPMGNGAGALTGGEGARGRRRRRRRRKQMVEVVSGGRWRLALAWIWMVMSGIWVLSILLTNCVLHPMGY